MHNLTRCLGVLSVIIFMTGLPLRSSAEEKVVITMTGSSVGQEGQLIRAGADLYVKAHPNVEIKIFDVPDSTTARLLLYLKKLTAHESDLDIYQIDVIWPGEFAEHLQNLLDYGA